MSRATSFAAGVLALMALGPPALSAQVGNPLAQATGMADNYTALARGFGAVLWNPAGLGLPDNPRASGTLLPLTAAAGLSPVTAGDFLAFDGELISHDARSRWLHQIRAEGGETGSFGTDITYAAVSIGRFAASASSGVRARVGLGPDVAELILFGNAGLTGEPRSFSLEGSHVDVAGTTTVAGSVGVPVRLRLGPLPDQHLALGATLSYTVGNFLILGQEQGSTVGTTPVAVDVRFPMVHTPLPDDEGDVQARDVLNNGSGIGLDVGAAWQAGGFSAGLTIRNLINTFGWDRDALRYREGTAVWSADTAYTRFEDRPFTEAPAGMVARIDDLYTFAPVVAAGVAARVLPYLTLSGDLHHAIEDNLTVGARTHVGIGGELTVIPFLPVRAGLAVRSGGYHASAGLGLRIGAMQLAAAGAVRQAELGRESVGAVGLTFGVR